jgi:hypothetical protein
MNSQSRSLKSCRHKIVPKFSLQTVLRDRGVDCYQILRTNSHYCRHRPSGTECLVYWWENQWIIVGQPDTPAYQVVKHILERHKSMSNNGQSVGAPQPYRIEYGCGD